MSSSSLWLCTDPTPACNLQIGKNRRKSSSPFQGIFTEDPSFIGQILPRPKTPFPTDIASLFINKSDRNTVECDSAICFSINFPGKHFKPGELPIF